MCPYCGLHGFSADDTYPLGRIGYGEDPKTVRHMNKCSNPECLKWSVWSPDEKQAAIPEPRDPKSVV